MFENINRELALGIAMGIIELRPVGPHSIIIADTQRNLCNMRFGIPTPGGMFVMELCLN